MTTETDPIKSTDTPRAIPAEWDMSDVTPKIEQEIDESSTQAPAESISEESTTEKSGALNEEERKQLQIEFGKMHDQIEATSRLAQQIEQAVGYLDNDGKPRGEIIDIVNRARVNMVHGDVESAQEEIGKLKRMGAQELLEHVAGRLKQDSDDNEKLITTTQPDKLGEQHGELVREDTTTVRNNAIRVHEAEILGSRDCAMANEMIQEVFGTEISKDAEPHLQRKYSELIDNLLRCLKDVASKNGEVMMTSRQSRQALEELSGLLRQA
jgi:hypothetical protein